MAAVAEAVGRPLEEHPRLVDKARRFFGPDLGDEHLRMCRVPSGCELVESDLVRFPVIAVDGIYVLAGVPEIFRRGFETVKDRLPAEAADRLVSVYLMTDEWSLTPLLELTVAEFPGVHIGSYPDMFNEEYRIRLTFEAVELAEVTAAADHLVAALPAGVFVRREGDDVTEDG